MRILLGCGILHAMRRHKAWRGGSKRAAELRTRHRALHDSGGPRGLGPRTQDPGPGTRDLGPGTGTWDLGP